MAESGEGAHTDAEIVVESLVHPDRFGELLSRHATPVFKFLARQVGRDVADDLTAETFATAFRARSKFDPSYPSALPWLLGIATNLGRHHWRSEATQYQRVERASGCHRGTRGRTPRRGEAFVELSDALDPRLREALLMIAAFDLTYDEVARLLDVPIGTVRSRLSRARRQVRELLSDGGQYLTSNALDSVGLVHKVDNRHG